MAISTMAVGVIAVLVLSCGDGAVAPTPPPAPVATTVTVNPGSVALSALGETARLTAEVRDQNGQVMAGATVAWTSSDASVAAVDASGLVTAAANGSATITATAGSVSGTAAVTVAQAVSAVAVSPPADTLVALGDTVRLTAEATDANGHAAAGSEFSWSSSDTLVARVDASGLVTAAANGSATITATAGSVSGTAAVTVAQVPTSLALSTVGDTLVSGDTLRVTVDVIDANGHAVAESRRPGFAWASSDLSVVTVDDAGLIEAVGNGRATITVSAGGLSAQVDILVAVAKLHSAPPEWVFTGNLPETDRRMFREVMEHTRAYFAHHHGVQATGFTVLVGADYESLEPVYRDATGAELSSRHSRWAGFSHAWVTASPQGDAVVTFIYGWQDWAHEIVYAVVHEYFHVLQGQLAAGMTPLGNGKLDWRLSEFDFPRWLGEGLASYADYLYSEARSDWPKFLDDRYTPLKDLGTAVSDGDLDLDNLAGRLVESASGPICNLQNFTWYALSFMASVYMGERSPAGAHVEFWKLLGERASWQTAFREAFGLDPDGFTSGFEEWLRPQIPTWDYIDVEVRWPSKSTDPRIEGAFISIGLENQTWEGPWRVSNRRGPIAEPPAVFRVRVPGGTIGTVELAAWWTEDQRTKYLLGWHKDGGLTTNVNELTPLRFTGAPSGKLEWMLPAHPGTLRRLCGPAPLSRTISSWG